MTFLFSFPHLEIQEVGTTYAADHAQSNNQIAESSIDHVYNSCNMTNKITINKLDNSSSDHVPVVVRLESAQKHKIYTKKITKRSLKNFSQENWNKSLASKNWSKLEKCTDVMNVPNYPTKIKK